eukprot:3612115-Prymnesium_polylepis.2
MMGCKMALTCNPSDVESELSNIASSYAADASISEASFTDTVTAVNVPVKLSDICAELTLNRCASVLRQE